jgi:hypothetical protein
LSYASNLLPLTHNLSAEKSTSGKMVYMWSIILPFTF